MAMRPKPLVLSREADVLEVQLCDLGPAETLHTGLPGILFSFGGPRMSAIIQIMLSEAWRVIGGGGDPLKHNI